MVVINLTLVVIFAMFLVFLWAMGRFVFRPLLEVMDQRDARVASDHATAERETHSAEQFELAYSSKIAALHREENRRVRQAHWDAQAAHNQRVAELKDREREELEMRRLEALRQIDLQREVYPPLVEELVRHTAERLGLKGESA